MFWQGTYSTVHCTVEVSKGWILNSLCKKCPHLSEDYPLNWVHTSISFGGYFCLPIFSKNVMKRNFSLHFKKNLPPTPIFRHGEQNVTEGGTCWRLWLVLPVIRLLWSAKSCGFLGMLILYLNTLVAQSDHLFRPNNCGDFLNTKAPVSSIGN